DQVLHAVDARTGAKRWTAGSGLGELQFLGAVRDLFLLAGEKGLYGFDAGTGRQVWHHPVSGGSGSWSAVPTDDHVFASWSGKLFCFSV
ncbi:PQQ-binding-like beta-propeller repeat protein, partial [Streptomyces sp. 2MCAF27]